MDVHHILFILDFGFHIYLPLKISWPASPPAQRASGSLTETGPGLSENRYPTKFDGDSNRLFAILNFIGTMIHW